MSSVLSCLVLCSILLTLSPPSSFLFPLFPLLYCSQVPLVVRLEGTNVELGKKLIRESGLKVVAADDLDDAAKKAVATLK